MLSSEKLCHQTQRQPNETYIYIYINKRSRHTKQQILQRHLKLLRSNHFIEARYIVRCYFYKRVKCNALIGIIDGSWNKGPGSDVCVVHPHTIYIYMYVHVRITIGYIYGSGCFSVYT